MIHFADKTFCPFWQECEKGSDCTRALTDTVRKDAETWWAQWDTDEPMAVPICRYTEKPKCFKEIK